MSPQIHPRCQAISHADKWPNTSGRPRTFQAANGSASALIAPAPPEVPAGKELDCAHTEFRAAVSYLDRDFSTRSMTASNPGWVRTELGDDGSPHGVAQVSGRRGSRTGPTADGPVEAFAMDLQTLSGEAVTSRYVCLPNHFRLYSPQAAAESRPQPDTPMGLRSLGTTQIGVPAASSGRPSGWGQSLMLSVAGLESHSTCGRAGVAAIGSEWSHPQDSPRGASHERQERHATGRLGHVGLDVWPASSRLRGTGPTASSKPSLAPAGEVGVCRV